MASRAEYYQGSGSERSFAERAGWVAAWTGLALIGVGVLGGSDSLAALGLALTVGGVLAGSLGGKSK